MKYIIKNISILAALLIFATITGRATPAQADPIRADVSFGSTWLYADSPGYDKVDENNWFRAGGFGLRYFAYGPLTAGYAFYSNDTRNTDPRRLYRSTFELEQHLLDLGAHYAICDYFETYAALGAVKYFASFVVEPSGEQEKYIDSAWGFQGKFGVDLLLPTPRREAAVSLYAEAGYASEVNFAFKTVGDISVGGPTFSAGIRFHMLDGRKIFGQRQVVQPQVVQPPPPPVENTVYPTESTTPTY
jgi:hypothetical protein